MQSKEQLIQTTKKVPSTTLTTGSNKIGLKTGSKLSANNIQRQMSKFGINNKRSDNNVVGDLLEEKDEPFS